MRQLRQIVLLFCIPCLAQSNPRIPDEVRYKSGYINSPRPPDFTSAMLWGIAIADTRVPGFEHAQIEIARTQLTCRGDGKDLILNDDHAAVRGGLYSRHPASRASRSRSVVHRKKSSQGFIGDMHRQRDPHQHPRHA